MEKFLLEMLAKATKQRTKAIECYEQYETHKEKDEALADHFFKTYLMELGKYDGMIAVIEEIARHSEYFLAHCVAKSKTDCEYILARRD